MSLKKDLQDNQIIVILIPTSLYVSKINDIIKTVANQSNKTCYLALNKPYKSMMQILQKNKIDPKKFFFIDAISKTVSIPEPQKNAEFLATPKSLTKLSLSITYALENRKIDSVLFDSLSTLLVYASETQVIKFAHFIMAKIRTTNSKGIFISLKEDVQSDLLNDLQMFADKVIDLSKKEGGEK